MAQRLAALTALVLCGCARQGVPRAALPSGAAGAETVALVDGRPIGADAVARQAAAAGTDARAALASLIDAELLAAEAERRGLVDDPDVIEAGKRELVRRLLADGFERDVTPAVITDEELAKFYARARGRLDHPDVRLVRHVFVRFRKGDDEARRRALRERMARVAERARAVHDAESFVALAPALSDGDVALKAEDVATARDWQNFDQAFRAATFAIPAPGQSSGVVESAIGYHVIFYERLVPEEHIDFAHASDKLRETLWPDRQRREFGAWVDGRVDRHRITVFPDRLASGQPGEDEQRGAAP
jgi:hypothetical protein